MRWSFSAMIFSSSRRCSSIKSSNAIEGLKDSVAIGKGTWLEGWCKRGKIIDEILNGHKSGKGILKGTPLGENFPVVDRLIKDEKTLVSTKSLDLNATSYQDASKLKSRLNRYAEELSGFEKKWLKDGSLKRGETELFISDYDNKVLEIIVPDTVISEDVAKELNRFAKESMKDYGVTVWYRIGN